MNAGDYYRAWREELDRIRMEEARATDPTTGTLDVLDRLDFMGARIEALDRLLDGIEERLTGRPAVVVALALHEQSQRYLGAG